MRNRLVVGIALLLGWSCQLSARAQPEQEEPFVEAQEISGAIAVRLGNEMLAALADSVPHVISEDALSGAIGDSVQQTVSQGFPVQVQLSGINYSAALSRVVLQAQESGLVRVHISLRDVQIRINQIHVTAQIGGFIGLFIGSPSAVTGPMTITLGHRRDLPMELFVRPVVRDRKLGFELVETRFQLPTDNMDVGSPAWVSSSSFLMTRSRVTQGLREGFYKDPGRIEKELIEAAPGFVTRMEDRLQMDDINPMVADVWPMPVYAPRVKAWPESVQVDGEGMTVRLGLVQAAVSSDQQVDQIRKVELSAPELGGSKFQFGLNPAVLEPISALLVDSGEAKILVEDLPMEALHQLGDAAKLAELIPDLNQRPDKNVRTEVRLASPIRMIPSEGGSIALELPKALFTVHVHPEAGSNEWVPYVVIDLSLMHAANPSVLAVPGSTMLSLNWQGDAQTNVTAQFAEGITAADNTINVDGIKAIIQNGWQEWTSTGPVARVPLDELNLGFSKITPQSSGVEAGLLTTTFDSPTTTIDNFGQGAIQYEIKGPYSNWGGPFTLAAGQTHSFVVAYPMTVRFQSNGQTKRYTLSPGTAFQFQAAADGLDLYLSPL